ncbi:MAG TPA: hypothetical protein DIU15_05325 [Deltaproteobacteria bacterium]|nr:hypothetical protein [Deltaproteobacteria bacterium]
MHRLAARRNLLLLSTLLVACGPGAAEEWTDVVHSDAPSHFCGDGHQDADEECDDGNQSPEDGCGSDCLLEPCTDQDEDGYCVELDCDDLDAEISPTQSEILCNEADDDCDPLTLDAPDNDDDGFTLCEEDCDDDPLAAPDLPELCEGQRDDDCDGDVDCWDSECSSDASCPGECGNELLEAGESCDDGNRITGDGCSSNCLEEYPAAAASELVEAPGDTGVGFFKATNATNGVFGGGLAAGSQDTFSLGYIEGVNNYVVIGWGDFWAVNGPGVDFVVFENAFEVSPGVRFMDHAVIYLSLDGETWVPFPHDYTAPDETVYSMDPDHWQGFAGVEPVLLNELNNPVDPFDSLHAGGDAFDLDLLPDDGGPAQQVRELGFSYLKLVTAPTVINPDTDDFFVRDPVSNGADIDGVYARYLVGE